MRLFIFLFLTVTSLSMAEAQNTSCPRLAEGSTTHKVSMQCFFYGPQISMEYGSIYFNIARDDHEVLLLLLRVQRTERNRYTPDKMRNLIEYLVLNIHRQLWKDFTFWRKILPEEAVAKMLEVRKEFTDRFTDIERVNDEASNDFVLSFSRDFSQSKLDELHDWLVNNKIGDFNEQLDPLPDFVILRMRHSMITIAYVVQGSLHFLLI